MRMWRSGLAVLAASTLALVGCSFQQGSGRSSTEARDHFTAALDDIEVLVGGTWENLDDPTARDCVIPIGVAGEKFPGFRVGESLREPSGAVLAVESEWVARGYAVERTDVAGVTELQTQTGDGELLIFRASDEGLTLQGESECVPIA